MVKFCIFNGAKLQPALLVLGMLAMLTSAALEHDHSNTPKCSEGCPPSCECLGGTFCGNSTIFAESGDEHEAHEACKKIETNVEAALGTAEPSVDPSSADPVCFPGDALVTIAGGLTKRMSNLQIGDRVLVAPGEFSEVLMFTHKLPKYSGEFVELKTKEAAIQLTHSHLIYANEELVPAGRVKVGDSLKLMDGSKGTVLDIGSVVMTGLYNPQTTHRDIVVC